MGAPYETEQEEFWAGEFGGAYTARNRGKAHVAGNLALFSRILARTREVRSVLELGANIGLNLEAISLLLPGVDMTAVEINEEAAAELRRSVEAEVFRGSILEYAPERRFDLILTKGVLIHLAPERLTDVYDRMFEWASRYVCVVEYYNPNPVEMEYRGHHERLFKRDFAGELLDRFPEMRLCDYGFVYHRDPVFPGDDLSWFLLEKP